jgi:sec-independent protein translocase protein TatA
MFGLGTKEIIIIAVVLVLLFGSKKIPELAKSIVEAVKHLRGAFKDDDTPADPALTNSSNKKK